MTNLFCMQLQPNAKWQWDTASFSLSLVALRSIQGNHHRVGLGLSEPDHKPLAFSGGDFLQCGVLAGYRLWFYSEDLVPRDRGAAKILWDEDDRSLTDVDGPDEKNFPSRKHFLEKRSDISKQPPLKDMYSYFEIVCNGNCSRQEASHIERDL
jgi:hypothetical protein